MKDRYKIGVITPFWPPLHGGAERYEYRLVERLQDNMFDVKVFTGTAKRPDRDNGNLDVVRFTPFGNFKFTELGKKEENFISRINYYHFMEAAFDWVKMNSFDIVILGNALQMFGAIFARELFLSIKALNIPVGLFNYDLSGVVEQILVEFYNPSEGWANVKEKAVISIKKLGSSCSDLEALHIIRSPLVFRPDFVICDSHWTSFFIDPHGNTPKFVFHPMTSMFSKQNELAGELLQPTDVLMINPQKRKNPEAMLNLIRHSPELKYRILKGGWGNSFDTFVPLVRETLAYKNGNIELLEYAENIASVYKSSKVMFFPSTAEGYGMAAVEPMYCGTPVLSSNYPAIIEGVGDAAYSLCPHTSTGADWANGLYSILKDYDGWQLKIRDRVAFLNERENLEFEELIEFFDCVVNKKHVNKYCF